MRWLLKLDWLGQLLWAIEALLSPALSLRPGFPDGQQEAVRVVVPAQSFSRRKRGWVWLVRRWGLDLRGRSGPELWRSNFAQG